MDVKAIATFPAAVEVDLSQAALTAIRISVPGGITRGYNLAGSGTKMTP